MAIFALLGLFYCVLTLVLGHLFVYRALRAEQSANRGNDEASFQAYPSTTTGPTSPRLPRP
eukprot:1033424-Alexandrium_andersonii.AAC.1